MSQCHIETKDTELTEKQKEHKRKNIPAFPVNIYEGKWVDGMYLRDYFAAKVLQGYLSKMAANPLEKGSICQEMQAETNTEALAKASYLFADAMMKAREV